MNVYTALSFKEFVLQVFDVNFGELSDKRVGLCHFYTSRCFWACKEERHSRTSSELRFQSLIMNGIA